MGTETAPHHTDRDGQFANRMIVGGILLLLLPVSIVIIVFSYLSIPLLSQLLPRGYQPIAPARFDEALVLITSFQGEGTDAAEALDEQFADALTDIPYYSTGLRVGRLLEMPTSHTEASALADEYNARVVVWGDVTGRDVRVNLTLGFPVALIEPEQVSFLIEDADSEAFEQLVMLIMTQLELRNAQAAYSEYISVTEWSNRMPTDSSLRLDPVIVAFYQAEAERISSNEVAARRIIADALEAYGDAPLLLLEQAILLRNQARFDEALERTDQVLARDDSINGAYQLRADIYLLEGETNAALDDLSKALENDPDNPLILRTRAEAFRALEDYNAAISDYETQRDLQPNSVEPLLALAEIARVQGQLEQALDFYDQASDLTERNGQAYLYDSDILPAQADILIEMEDYETALVEYDQRLKDNPSDIWLISGKGIVLWESGDQAAARYFWEQNITNFSYDRAIGFNSLAWELYLRGYPEPALRYAEEAVDLAPTDPNILHTLGAVYLELERYTEALDFFEQALSEGLVYDQINRDIGHAHFGLGQYNQAIANYERYLGILPFAQDSADVLERLETARDRLAQ